MANYVLKRKNVPCKNKKMKQRKKRERVRMKDSDERNDQKVAWDVHRTQKKVSATSFFLTRKKCKSYWSMQRHLLKYCFSREIFLLSASSADLIKDVLILLVQRRKVIFWLKFDSGQDVLCHSYICRINMPIVMHFNEK